MYLLAFQPLVNRLAAETIVPISVFRRRTFLQITHNRNRSVTFILTTKIVDKVIYRVA